MADNVFGNPITDSTLEGMPEYKGKTITHRDRAHVALNMMNAQDKNKMAREYVENLKRQWGSGISTLCLIYNATGDMVKFVTHKDWRGHIGPAPFPVEIANGQWGAFLHVKTFGIPKGSNAAVVYRGQNNDGSHCDWMASWYNPLNENNKVYTEIREEGHYDKNDYWDVIYNLLYNSGLNRSNNWNGCVSTVSIESDTSPIFEAIFTLQNVET